MAAEEFKPVTTIEAFEAFLAQPNNQERLYELVHGEVLEKVPNEEHGLIASNVHGALYVYLLTNPIGRVLIEVRYRAAADALNMRQPDISFIRGTDRPVTRKGAVPRLPDLAVEIKSPDDSLSALREKAGYYLANGCALIWLIYPERRAVEVYQPGQRVLMLSEGQVLTGGEVLPGFSLGVDAIFKGLDA